MGSTSSETGSLSVFFLEVADILKYKAVSKFSHYCDENELGEAAISPVKQSRLFMLDLNIGTVLAFSGRKKDFVTWRERYMGLMIQRELKPEVMRQHEDYMDELAKMLSLGVHP